MKSIIIKAKTSEKYYVIFESEHFKYNEMPCYSILNGNVFVGPKGKRAYYYCENDDSAFEIYPKGKKHNIIIKQCLVFADKVLYEKIKKLKEIIL